METALAAILGSLLALLGVLATVRQGRKSQIVSLEHDDRSEAMAAWQELVDPYRAEVAVLRGHVDTAEAKADEAAAAAHELTVRVDRLTRFRHVAVQYILLLIERMKAAGIDPPTPPHDLDLDTPEEDHQPP